jgi:hypothetical protein
VTLVEDHDPAKDIGHIQFAARTKRKWTHSKTKANGAAAFCTAGCDACSREANVVTDLEGDIGWFIDRHFHKKDLQAVFDVLEAGVFRTPRVTRSVLFLSNGSLSLLRHYARASVLDVRSVLAHAEHVAGDVEMPMQVRDMSLPLWHERNLASDGSFEGRSEGSTAGETTTKGADRSARHHAYVVNRWFKLGKVDYLVASRQPNSRRVRCFRKARSVVTLVELPLAFVLEQLAERIEITDTAVY